MRQLLYNQASLALAGIVLLSLTSNHYHGVDCQESGYLSFMRPFLERIGQSNLFRSQSSSSNKKSSEDFLRSQCENTKDDEQKNDEENNGKYFEEALEGTGKLLNTLKEKIFDKVKDEKKRRESSNDPLFNKDKDEESTSETPESEELFTDFQTDSEQPEENKETLKVEKFENSGTLSSSIRARDQIESSGSDYISFLKNIKLMFSMPIEIIKNLKNI